MLAIGFKARIVDGEPQAADDVAELRWVTAAEVDGLEFAWEHDRRFVKASLADEG